MVSGGAPLNPEIGSFFVALGVRLLQGYGQTEAAPVIACNSPVRIKIDTVGPPLDGVRVKIADDGEILVAGDNVMKGYWNDPEATAQVLEDGWLKTGDVGLLDADGYIRITDRKRDFIKNSGGETISPARVEGYSDARARDRSGNGVRRPPALSGRRARARSGLCRRLFAGDLGRRFSRACRRPRICPDDRRRRGPSQSRAFARRTGAPVRHRKRSRLRSPTAR